MTTERTNNQIPGGNPHANWVPAYKSAMAGLAIFFLFSLAAPTALGQERSVHQSKIPRFVLTDSEGELFSSEALEGKIVVLDFWATWCAPCLKSIPEMKKAESAFREDPSIVFLFINTLESTARDLRFTKEFLAKKNLPLYFLVDSDSATKNGESLSTILGISGLPTSIILDGKGNVSYRSSGFTGDSEDILYKITPIIENIKKSEPDI